MMKFPFAYALFFLLPLAVMSAKADEKPSERGGTDWSLTLALFDDSGPAFGSELLSYLEFPPKLTPRGSRASLTVGSCAFDGTSEDHWFITLDQVENAADILEALQKRPDFTSKLHPFLRNKNSLAFSSTASPKIPAPKPLDDALFFLSVDRSHLIPGQDAELQSSLLKLIEEFAITVSARGEGLHFQVRAKYQKEFPEIAEFETLLTKMMGSASDKIGLTFDDLKVQTEGRNLMISTSLGKADRIRLLKHLKKVLEFDFELLESLTEPKSEPKSEE